MHKKICAHLTVVLVSANISINSTTLVLIQLGCLGIGKDGVVTSYRFTRHRKFARVAARLFTTLENIE